MFEGVAPRYDLLNHLLSFNVDRSWRKRLMKAAEPVLRNPHSRILDLCCGTGDVLLDLQSKSVSPILGADFLPSDAGDGAAQDFGAPLEVAAV